LLRYHFSYALQDTIKNSLKDTVEHENFDQLEKIFSVSTPKLVYETT
jgi:hypothetical protein